MALGLRHWAGTQETCIQLLSLLVKLDLPFIFCKMDFAEAPRGVRKRAVGETPKLEKQGWVGLNLNIFFPVVF